MFTYSFSDREKALLIVLLCLLLGVFYYFVVQVPVSTRMEQTQAAAEDSMVLEMIKAGKMQRVQAAIDAADADTRKAEISPYNNIQNVMVQLDEIIGSATADYDISFLPIITEEGLVHRPISMTFTCADYAAAKAVLVDLNACRYRCMIDSVSIEPVSAESESIASSRVEVSLTMTFIEKN